VHSKRLSDRVTPSGLLRARFREQRHSIGLGRQRGKCWQGIVLHRIRRRGADEIMGDDSGDTRQGYLRPVQPLPGRRRSERLKRLQTRFGLDIAPVYPSLIDLFGRSAIAFV